MICKLKDISIDNRGYYGIGAPAVNYDSDKYTYLRITDINDDGSLNKKSLMSVDDINANKYILQKNDIVFARTGASTGRNYFYDGEIKNLVYAGFLIKFSLNDKLVNPRYIKYYCLSKKYNDWILSTITGSTRPNINEKQLSEMPIYLPDRKVQNKAVKIMDALNNKIKLNAEINDNLFKQELVIYNEWFVNYKFPDIDDKYKESELGNIPNNWEVGYFGDNVLTKIVKSGVKRFNGEKEYLATADVDGTIINNSSIITYENRPSRANMTPIENSIWFAKMENSKKNILVMDYMENLLNSYIFSTGFMGIECINNSVNYLWCLINDKNFLNKKNNNSTGTLMAGLSNNTTKNIKYVIPDKTTMIKFNEIVNPINKKIYYNNKENKVLEQLRDNLLLKLINGEINLENIEI